MRGMSADDRHLRQVKTEIAHDLAEGLQMSELAERFESRHPARAGRTSMSEFRVLVEEVQQSCTRCA